MLAIEFTEDRILLVEGKAKNKKITVKKTHSFSFDESWTNQQGVIQVDVLADKLDSELKKYGFKGRSDVVICFNHFNSIFRDLRVPYVEGKRLDVLVRTEMMNTLNLSNDFLIDYVILDEIENEEGHFLELLVVAIHQEFLESYLKVCKKANLRVRVGDFGVNTLIKMMEASSHLHVNQLSIVLKISRTNLKMHLFDSFDYTFTRSVSFNQEEELLPQIMENLNKMIQFMYTKVSVKEYTQIVLMGEEELVEQVRMAVETDLNLPCVIFDMPHLVSNQSGESLQPYVNAIGTMMRRSKP